MAQLREAWVDTISQHGAAAQLAHIEATSGVAAPQAIKELAVRTDALGMARLTER